MGHGLRAVVIASITIRVGIFAMAVTDPVREEHAV